MITAFLLAPLMLVPVQDDPFARQEDPVAQYERGRRTPLRDVDANPYKIRIIDISDLTGADRLGALRDAIENELLDEEVRIAALERYLDLVASGEMEDRAQGLVKSIKTFCEPEASDMRIAVPGPGELIVAADARTHRWIDDFLAGTRRFDGMVDFEMRMFDVTSGTASEVWDGRTGVLLDEAATTALLERLMASKDVSSLAAPRVLTFPGAPANLFVGEQTAYIKDYEVTVLPDSATEIADPVIDVVQTGTSIDVLAIPLGLRRLAVEIEFQQATAERPFPEFTTTIGANTAPVTLQLPEVKTSKVAARFELDPGSSIALSVKNPEDETKDIIVLMRAKRVEAERLEDPFGEPSLDLEPVEPEERVRPGGRRSR